MIAVSKNKRAVCTNTLSYRDLLHNDSPFVFHLSKCLVYLGRETHWALRPRRLVRREDAR